MNERDSVIQVDEFPAYLGSITTVPFNKLQGIVFGAVAEGTTVLNWVFQNLKQMRKTK